MTKLALKLVSLPQVKERLFSEDEIVSIYKMAELLAKLEMLEWVKINHGISCKEEVLKLNEALVTLSKQMGMQDKEVVEVITDSFGLIGLREEEID